MKNLVLIFAFMLVSTLSFAQETTPVILSEIVISEDVKETPAKTKSSKKEVKANAVIKSQLIKLNHKKSNEIISIKAYRKSLQIKTKTVKLC